MKEKLVIKAPAKVNLTLDVKGKRADGYHELETVMQQISLVDIIHLSVNDTGEIASKSNSSLIPDHEENLAYQAAALMKSKYGLQAGLDIFIEKNIPVGAGLAGGSTDAAAVLQGINELFRLDIKLPKLMELGAEIGSDVPFCLLGGAALAKGRGEILTSLKAGLRLEMVLVKPDFQISTAEVYRQFSLDKVERAPDNVAFLAAWDNEDSIQMTRQMVNVLESVSINKYPEIEKIKQELISMGALTAIMSGSGPTVFGAFRTREDAQRAYDKIKRRYAESYIVSSYSRGD